ncbi:MAG: TIGR01212 family radical SAM protein [gamma proteobacterium symbiont of Bathyaustriella thionipta]|nr:TIGR01212 family radical SAM protein [gamma proteobacterium symbiont of Bathyaustriella thionipta]MCU7951013.1 TIGR01212 family radical SAM protein [gamma proteobacterium symbiont of Bathyaustriella thionipta]MCU7953946.1 TIGR01212 family radical SAM protein [gamma proteobacterium symbiont of Bathyaustriella thionipta]MCU7957515.1 TIGR01212 family radical SAM protein [gamma proteobacterium symbiont of Bathyaustriella thionipta]MCU7968339.1 TIGR01212 family radical SAM protein [gamma proteoba
MYLDQTVLTFGRAMREKYGYKVHKLSIDAQFTCPNRDGTKGIGGCTFCNNTSFSPNSRTPPSIDVQIDAGRNVILKRTGAIRYLAYFQAYTNTYADIHYLKSLYDSALSQPDVIGLSIGTRPDCVPDGVLKLLAQYQEQGYEIWLELGLQSSFDSTLKEVNRGHSFAEYQDAIQRAHQYNLQVCTHLIVGLPTETIQHSLTSMSHVLETRPEGIKIHPLHIVKGTQIARQWKNGNYQPLTMNEYVDTVINMVKMAPDDMIFHRLTGTASEDLLLAPNWCNKKWLVLNEITRRLSQNNQSVLSSITKPEMMKYEHNRKYSLQSTNT